MTTLAFHSDPAIKSKYRDRMRRHIEADELVAGVGYETSGEKSFGCFVGCTFDKYDHARGPIEIGYPEAVMHLGDAIHEGLAMSGKVDHGFALAMLDAKPGADLSLVWPRFALALLSDPKSPVTKAANTKVCPAIDGVAALFREWVDTGVKPSVSRFDRAAWAAWAAEATATAPAKAAAWAAGTDAAWADAAWAADAAADAWATRAAKRNAWQWQRDLLVRLIAEAPVKGTP